MDIKTRKIDVQITNPDGSVVFERKDVEIPEEWSDKAATIVANKYFADGENSAICLIERVVGKITDIGRENGYFASSGEADIFYEQLTDILIDQRASFNSPVWFNIGVNTNSQQSSACFIYDVEDNMEDILAFSKRIGMTYKNGSGTGVNISKLRAKGEFLSNRGVASGPLSFMRIWDQVAGSIKSGGKTRRSAAMVVMDVDHPDIEEFITCKAYEEDKAKILINSGISTEEAYATVSFQNANHSVMLTDKFMEAVSQDKDWPLINRGNKDTAKIISARKLFKLIAKIAWETGDPGVQFYNTINKFNTIPSLGDILCPNPCTEFLAPKNSACNLASMNLVKYQHANGFDFNKFGEDIAVMITAQDILIDGSSYPIPEVAENAHNARPLGLGYTNLGALLMHMDLPYNSNNAIKCTEKITRAMTQFAYIQSINLAKKVGPYKLFEENKQANISVAKHLNIEKEIIQDIGKHGLRNSQLTLLAPAGTISFMMDCDTTGIEPLYALKTYKKLARGGTLELIPECVKKAKTKHSEDSPIFSTAMSITAMDHMAIMAAAQKYLHGAISKTINIPAEATVEDVEDIYMTAWKLGLKSVAIYRDGCKNMQPLADASNIDIEEEEEIEEDNTAEPTIEESNKWVAIRRKLPDTRQSITHKFDVRGLEGYITVGFYGEGDIGEIFIRTQKQGTTVQGLLDGFATPVSLALQYGVPPATFVEKFVGSKFEPDGITTNEEIRFATSILDYVFRWIKKEFLDEDEDEAYITETPITETQIVKARISFDGPPCPTCQTITGRSGSCYLCPTCGSTTGCS